MSKFTIKDFRAKYPDDNACLDELMRRKFGNHPKCLNPDCDHETTTFYRVKGRKVYECQWCGYQISPTADTIFHKSATPLADWFYVMYLMTATRAGVSAKEVERQLGVTYKTAWRMCHQIRKAMADDGNKLNKKVEVDEGYIGGKGYWRAKERRDMEDNKSVILGMVERKGRARAIHVPSSGARALLPQIQKNVEPNTKIYSDEYGSYKMLNRMGYKHGVIRHKDWQFVKGDIHTQNVENFWSNMKRGVTGVYRHVSPQHLQKYADEYAFRYNQRATLTPMFERLLQNLVRPL